MKNKSIKFFSFFLVIISTLLFLFSFIFGVIDLKIFSITIFIVSNVLFTLEDVKRHVVFLIFNLSFSLFLFSRFLLNYFFGYESTEYGLYGTNFHNIDTINFMLNILFISIFFFTLSYLFFGKIKTKNEPSLKSKNLIFLKRSSIILFLVTLVFKIIYIKDQSNFVLGSSYYDYFLNYQSNIPTIFVKLAELNLISYISFLSCKPDVKNREFKVITILFTLISIYSMTVGRRIEFMLNVLLIISFLVMNKEKKQNKLSFKNKMFLLFGSPLVLVLLNFVSNKRDAISYKSAGLFDSIGRFLFSQGVSVNLLGYTYEFQNSLPKDKFYSFGPLIEFLQNNIIYKTLFGNAGYSGQTVERAMEGHLFAHTISYFIMPTAYLYGRGYGSSYIAELYYDFGFIGLIIFNVLIGLLLQKLPILANNRNWLMSLFALLCIRNIYLLPRAEFISFLTNSVTLINILGVVLIFVLSKILEELNKNKNRVS
ncbi:O-antigen polysaccharide polymerase Wzy family protein [Vagococcus fluvialis]|uniref:O-antigen polysaccharide polymerase Wzy family protein n=1 Tax=Vagococcus fluvialis TaxID=2738 RepID=UPI001A8ED096|nr:O-antigen polysaccharide polymerase Wzy family protein [Vagococcus fluvialis]MBO0479511.1 O-antigen polysaccharide polymerase Wzy family protein [Vagococcus fluvialis]MBO0484851.1 O-antigen polysaccharide polymerase Wzy family protein [Vagococcus fluvialis]